jgi:hypothetical protein
MGGKSGETGYGTGTACARGQTYQKGKTSPWFMLLVVAQVPPCICASLQPKFERSGFGAVPCR